ncbi:Uncharacterised protein [Serratia marcescens]|nr:Uncharacterised protein [Serratia marcescens]
MDTMKNNSFLFMVLHQTLKHPRVPFLSLDYACGRRGIQSIGVSPCCSSS